MVESIDPFEFLGVKNPANKGMDKKGKRKAVPNSIKREVEVRQDFKCARCGNKLPAIRHFHHKIPVSEGGKNTTDNVIVLCANCHYDIHHIAQVAKANEKANTFKEPKNKNWWELDLSDFGL